MQSDFAKRLRDNVGSHCFLVVFGQLSTRVTVFSLEFLLQLVKKVETVFRKEKQNGSHVHIRQNCQVVYAFFLNDTDGFDAPF